VLGAIADAARLDHGAHRGAELGPGYYIQIPPLRERPGEIPTLAQWLLDKHAAESRRTPPSLSPAVQQALLGYSWPGNVRELSNMMERCVLMAGDTVELCDLPEDLIAGDTPVPRSVDGVEDLFSLSYHDAVTAARRLIVMRALEQAGGHQTRAAQQIGVTQPYLSRLIRQLGIRRQDLNG
jgi:two-component system, NtrC family, response regulator AtoC